VGRAPHLTGVRDEMLRVGDHLWVGSAHSLGTGCRSRRNGIGARPAPAFLHGVLDCRRRHALDGTVCVGVEHVLTRIPRLVMAALMEQMQQRASSERNPFTIGLSMANQRAVTWRAAAQVLQRIPDEEKSRWFLVNMLGIRRRFDSPLVDEIGINEEAIQPLERAGE
jgi:hypothetical protein